MEDSTLGILLRRPDSGTKLQDNEQEQVTVVHDAHEQSHQDGRNWKDSPGQRIETWNKTSSRILESYINPKQ